jgi:hypothetical protein
MQAIILPFPVPQRGLRQLDPLRCFAWFAAIAISFGVWTAAGFYLARLVS